jgi:hypothetical protein
MTTTNGHNHHITKNFLSTIKSATNSVDTKSSSDSATDNNETELILQYTEGSNSRKPSASEIFAFINSQLIVQRKNSFIEEAVEQFNPNKKNDSTDWSEHTVGNAERTSVSSTPEAFVKKAEIATKNFNEEIVENDKLEENAKIIVKENEDIDKTAKKNAEDAVAKVADAPKVASEKVNKIWRNILG